MGLTSGPVRSPHATLMAAFPTPSQHLRRNSHKGQDCDSAVWLQQDSPGAQHFHFHPHPRPKANTTTLSAHEPNFSLLHSRLGNSPSRQAGDPPPAPSNRLLPTSFQPAVPASGRSSPAPGPQDSLEGLSSPRREAVPSQHSGTEPPPPRDLLPARGDWPCGQAGA